MNTLVKRTLFTFQANLYVGILTILVQSIIGFGLFSDPRSSNFQGETLSATFVAQFVIYLLIVTILFYYMVVKHRKLGLKALYSTVFLVSIFMFVIEIMKTISDLQFGLYYVSISFFAIAIFCFLMVAMVIYVIGEPRVKIRNYGLLTICVLMSRVIALSLDLQTFIIIALMISVYDIWNVFRGPLTKLFGSPNRVPEERREGIPIEMLEMVCKQGTPVIIDLGQGLMTGIGDFFFYSALIFTGYLYWGLLGSIITFLCVNIGILVTHKLLKILSPLPGLPIPTLISLIGYLVLYLVS